MKNVPGLCLSILLFFTINACKNAEESASQQDVNVVEDGVLHLSGKTLEIYGIEFANLTLDSIYEVVEAPGVVDVPPSNRAEITTISTGRISRIEVIEGQHVKRGQVLAECESLEFLQLQEDYIKKLNEQELLRENLQRQTELMEEQITSRKKFLEARSALELKKAEVSSLAERLEMHNFSPGQLQNGKLIKTYMITSPIEGSVESVEPVLGHFIQPYEKLFSVINDEHLHLELEVYSKDIAKVQLDQQIIYSIPSLSDKNYTGKIFLVTKTLDRKSRSLNVHGHVDEKDKFELKPGMLVESNIVVDSQLGYKISEDGIVKSVEDFYVFEKVGEISNGVTVKPIKVSYIGTINGVTHFKAEKKLSEPIALNGAFHLLAMYEEGQLP